MINWKVLFPYIVIAFLLLFMFLRGCDTEREIVEVEVPGASGEFETVTEIVYRDRVDTVYITRWKEIEVETENPVNAELVEQYEAAKDSLERFKLYLNAIEEREFSQTFKDDRVEIDAAGTVRGELLGLSLDYNILPTTIEVRDRETVLRLLAGFEIGNNMTFSDFTWKANLGLQNRQGNIFTAGYNDRGQIFLGYNISLINFRR